jgi:uncharacterized protein (TIRG00374 family)
VSRSRLQHRLGLAARLLVVVGIFAVIARSVDFGHLRDALRGMAVLPVLVALALFLVNRVLTAVKWQLLLRDRGIQTSLPRLIHITFSTMFTGALIPSGLGTDVLRLVQVGREERNMTGAAGSVIADRMLGILALAVLSIGAAALAWPLLPDHRPLIWVLGLAVFLTAALLGITSSAAFRLYDLVHVAVFSRLGRLRFMQRAGVREWPERIRAKLSLIHAAQGEMLRKRRLFAKVFAWNILVQFLRVAQVHFLFLAMHADPPVPVVMELAVVPMIILLTLMPFTPFGVREGAFVYLFGMVGVAPEVSLATSLLSGLVSLVCMIPGALLFFFGGGKPRPAAA